MEEKRRKVPLRARAAQALDLPADALGGLPHLSLLGDRELLVENHRGILAYDTGEIQVGAGTLVIRVRGEDLVLRAMSAPEVLITGHILSVELI